MTNAASVTRRTVLAAAAFSATAAQASPGLDTLNFFNRMLSRGDTARLRGEGVPYGLDPRQKLDIWAPEVRNTNLPVIVFFYGGSWSSGDRADYRFVADAMVREGYMVVIPDYRLVPQVRFPGFVEDGAAAVAWVAKHIGGYFGDPKRIAVMGHSAGAYIAAMLALDPQWLRRAGAGPTTIKALVGLAGPYDFYPFDKVASQEAFGDWPEPRATQPISFASSAAPPSLLLTGADDTTVKPRNSHALAAALTAKGAVAERRDYPGVAHIGILLALARPFTGKAPVVSDVAGFLKGRV